LDDTGERRGSRGGGTEYRDSAASAISCGARHGRSRPHRRALV